MDSARISSAQKPGSRASTKSLRRESSAGKLKLPKDLQMRILFKKVMNIISESKIDEDLRHWEEYKIEGTQLNRRCYHSTVVYEDEMYVYGGYEYNLGIFSDFNKIKIADEATAYSWCEIARPKELQITKSFQSVQVVYPGPRARHTAVVYNDKMYLYGGLKNSTENTSEFWEFDFQAQTWSLVESSDEALPPSLDSHTADLWTSEENNTLMVVFGGFIGGKLAELANHVLSFNFATRQWETLWENQSLQQQQDQALSFPAQRMCHGSCIYGNKLYIFGGTDEEIKFGDLWCFDLNARTWQLLSAEGESPEPRHGLTLAVYKDKIILFGGIHELTHEKNDIYVYSLNTMKWTQVESDAKLVKNPENSPERSGKTEAQLTRGYSIKSRFEPATKRAEVTNEDQTRVSKKRGGNSMSDWDMAGTAYSTTNEAWMKSGQTKSLFKKWEKVKLQEPKKQNIKDIDSLKTPSNVEEKRQKGVQAKKMAMLKEFEVPEDAKGKFYDHDPRTELIKSSLQIIGNLEASQSLNLYMNREAHIKQSKNAIKKISGSKPRARDGQSFCLYGNLLLIFGGDRHKMCFHDLFSLNLSFFDKITL